MGYVGFDSSNPREDYLSGLFHKRYPNIKSLIFAESMDEKIAGIKSRFYQVYQREPELIVAAPGRVNLIGEHTDYNDGFVLPIAIDRHIIIASAPQRGNKIHLYAANFDEISVFRLDDIQYDQKDRWSNYQRGIAKLIQESGYRLRGTKMVIWGDIPLGAGLSSSAAVEVATALTFRIANDLPLSELELIKLAQRAENEFVGVNCGIMDQFVSCLGKKDNALFLDCRSLDYKYVPLKTEDFKVVVCNTGKRRELIGSEYNRRREECREGVRLLRNYLPGIEALRDVSSEDLRIHKGSLPAVIAKRCEHVVSENQRVLQSVQALAGGETEEFGRLMNQSQTSLRDLFQVSCEELDLMVEIARGVDGVLGSRMTGAGFGGCTISLVANEAISELEKRILKIYPQKTGLRPEIYVCQSEDGARRIF